jgi:mono/diheme cytochrome c family protein
VSHAPLAAPARGTGRSPSQRARRNGYDPPDPAERIELADSLYSPALFDTIDWASEQERAYAGNLVYADYCRRCHGTVGEGGTVMAAGNPSRSPPWSMPTGA